MKTVSAGEPLMQETLVARLDGGLRVRSARARGLFMRRPMARGIMAGDAQGQNR